MSIANLRAEYAAIRTACIQLHSKPYTQADFTRFVKAMTPMNASPKMWVESARNYYNLLQAAIPVEHDTEFSNVLPNSITGSRGLWV